MVRAWECPTKRFPRLAGHRKPSLRLYRGPPATAQTGVQMKRRKLTPAERVIYNYGHFDGERGLAPRSAQFTERQREIYNHAYGKGADLRYRARENVRRHANKIRARREPI